MISFESGRQLINERQSSASAMSAGQSAGLSRGKSSN